MAQSKRLRVSIVIPVYNEAERLDACLQAIARQKAEPYEVIVVDNNSIDDTAVIARRYAFVTLLTEPRQGVVHARNQGFDAVHGDIIGRIDADTILPSDWTERLALIFADSSVMAVSGAPHYYDQALSILGDTIDRVVRGRLARKLADNNFLYGANMALRRSAWQLARNHLCASNGLHEDLDLAIHLQALGLYVGYDRELKAGVSSRRFESSFASLVPYTLVSRRTYAAHNLNGKRHLWPAIVVTWLCYAPGRLLYRAYDRKIASVSLIKLFTAASRPRVDPTTNVA